MREEPGEPPKPCEYSDLIGGKNTGGLIAIMLGRLRMAIYDCVDAYIELSDTAFVKRYWAMTIKGNVQGKFDSKQLERLSKKYCNATTLRKMHY